jgi:hypothetical protein
MRRFEDVLEDALDIDPRAFVCKHAERAKAKVQRPDVIETKDVIGMAVSDEHCV